MGTIEGGKRILGLPISFGNIITDDIILGKCGVLDIVKTTNSKSDFNI